MNETDAVETRAAVGGSRLKRFVMWLFQCPPDRKLIMVWRTKDEVHALGQVVTTTTISIGSYKVISWVTIFTPIADWKK